MKGRNFKTAYSPDYIATSTEITGITPISREISLPTPFIKDYSNKWKLPYSDIIDIIKNGIHLYYVVYSNCHYDHVRHEYHVVSHSVIIYGNSKKSIKEYIMKGHRAARGYADGRCVNCIFEIATMHPYEIAKMLNTSPSFKDSVDEEKWYPSYCKDYPGVLSPVFIEEICREYEKKYGESVDAWKCP